jgi:CubicO group peptidase (beta-lactamase class C family)
MSSSPFSAEVTSTFQSKLDEACAAAAGPHQIPGTVFVVVDRHGTQKFAHAAGKRGFETEEPMTLDSIFWIASCTKLITVVACMQLVEKGLLALDDEASVEKYLPELKDVRVLVKDESGKLKLEEKKRAITLRMLLSHTGLYFSSCILISLVVHRI